MTCCRSIEIAGFVPFAASVKISFNGLKIIFSHHVPLNPHLFLCAVQERVFFTVFLLLWISALPKTLRVKEQEQSRKSHQSSHDDVVNPKP